MQIILVLQTQIVVINKYATMVNVKVLNARMTANALVAEDAHPTAAYLAAADLTGAIVKTETNKLKLKLFFHIIMLKNI